MKWAKSQTIEVGVMRIKNMLEMMLKKDCLCKLVFLMKEGHVLTLGGLSPFFSFFFWSCFRYGGS
jgi:hypothetical protein